MCGIAGFLTLEEPDNPFAIATRMADAIVHRGPDSTGVWGDKAAGVMLAHRRLAILDLTQAGAQPMMSACGRYVIVFNGEVYNFESLRIELKKAGAAPHWRGRSDTEVIVAAIATWGLEAALKQFVGMFAFALWDRENRTLSLARDRLGEKPLYYGWSGKSFLFGSELKALRVHPSCVSEINRDAITLLLRHNTIPAPHSIYRGIHKLPPGTFVNLTEQDAATRKQPSPVMYWSARSVAESRQRDQFQDSDAQAETELERLLSEAVGGQMVSDVPLGAFLSGGIDSSTVVALMQTQSSPRVRTFTIGFDEAGYNEAEHARAVARHLGTDHTELYVTPRDAMDVIPNLAAIYDEPFADPSQIPTVLVSRLARQHVTVCLSGDGGDELFGGYNRHYWVHNLWGKFGWMPRPLKAALVGALTTLPPTAWNAVFKQLGRLVPARLRYATMGDKLHKAAEILDQRSPDDIYQGLVSHWNNPARLVPGSREPATLFTDPSHRPDLPDFEHHMMYMDQTTYLPDDILTKLDRAAMAVSLETRVPFLDHRIVEFAWSLPLAMKIRHGQGKWLLRQVLYRHVPKELIDRPKMGFGIPIDHWLRGSLKPWAAALIEPGRLAREGFFDPAPIQRKWDEHQAGRRNWSYHLWSVLMFQAWLDRMTH